MLKQFLRESQQGPTARSAVDELPLASILRLLLHDSTRAQRDGCLRACRKEDDPVVTAGRPPVAGCHMGREKAAPGVEVPKLWAIARTRALGLWLSAIYRKSLTRCLHQAVGFLQYPEPNFCHFSENMLIAPFRSACKSVCESSLFETRPSGKKIAIAGDVHK
jgi:hypothetical protein